MTALLPVRFPGSRLLAAWWQELESFHPRSLWLGWFCLHRIEGSVRVVTKAPLERIEQLLLHFLQSIGPAEASEPWDRLSLNPALVFRIVNGLAAEGLVVQGGQGRWLLTPLGLEALAEGTFKQVHEERRVFSFLSAGDGEAPHFVRLLSDPSPSASLPCSDPHFDPAHYQACFAQSLQWKKRRDFPENVSPVPAAIERPVNGQHLLIDDPLCVLLALIRTDGAREDGGLRGFWVEPDTWSLRSAQPAFHLGECWQEVFPGVTAELTREALWKAWQTWCQPRGLPQTDIGRCSLQLMDYRLLAQVSRRLLERLQAARSDALNGKAWILLGEGPVRRAALLEAADRGDEATSIAGAAPRNKRNEGA